MANPTRTPLALLALLAATPALAGAGDVEAGLYTGLVMPGPDHELYAPADAFQQPINPGPTLGGRASYRPIDLLAAEGEAHLAFGSVTGAGGALLYAYRAQLLGLPPLSLPADIEPFLAAGIGNIGIQSSTDVLGADLDWAAHLGLGARIPVADKLGLRVDVRHLFADRNVGLGKPGGHSEVLVGVSYRLAPAGDRDGDGISDGKDRCVEQQETLNGYADDDGCPDMLATATLSIVDTEGLPAEGITVFVDGNEVGRTDASGQLTVAELMPETDVVLRGEHFHMERPEEVDLTLAEGTNEARLQMEWRPGRVRVVTMADGEPMREALVSFTGPKEIDASLVDNGDQIFYLSPGDWQVLVTAATFGSQLVELSIGPDERSLIVIEMQLEPAKVQVTLEEVVILQQILFESGSSDIEGGSIDLVREVTATILANPHIRRIQIQGHTDNQGSATLNRKLSQSRVDSVMQWMIDHGVPAEKLEAVGFGEDQPIASNATAEGRAQNRRVVFAILEQDRVIEE